jgi:hypothetical protein
MACCDCDDCLRNVECGGKCERFEYNCPFVVVENYDHEELRTMRTAVEEISEAIERLAELDSKEYMEEMISGIKIQLSYLSDAVNEDIEKEWNEIQ